MRRIAWVVAVFGAAGAAGLAARTGIAAEPAGRTRLTQAPKTAAPTDTTDRAKTRGLKNYADELFGEEEEEAAVSTKPAAPASTAAAKTPASKSPLASPNGPSKGMAAKTASPAAAPKTAASKEESKDAFDRKDDLDAEFVRMLNASSGSEAKLSSKATSRPSDAALKSMGSKVEPAVADSAEKNLSLDTDVEAFAGGKGIQQVAGESAAYPARTAAPASPPSAAPWARNRPAETETVAAPPARAASKYTRLSPAAAEESTQPETTAAATPTAPVPRSSFIPSRKPVTATPATTAAATSSKLTTPIDIDPPAATASPTTPSGFPQKKSTVSFSKSGGLPETTRPAAESRPAFAPRTVAEHRPSEPALRPATSHSTAAQGAPNVTTTWRATGAINIGQECTCELVVKNDGTAAASGLEIEATFPKNVRLVSAEPKPTSQTGFLGWKMDSLAAGEERIIAVKLVPLQRGQIETDARVRFSGTAKNAFTVAEPLLAIKVEGPKQVMIGEPAPHTVLVTNPGTGIATNVKIEAVIPEGLEHVRGGRLVMDLGSLNPGETRNVRLACAAIAGGQHKLQVRAIADADLAESASSEVAVIAPQLKTAIDGPGLRYLGRQGAFSVSVQNSGSVATDNVRVMHKIPEGFDFVSAGRGATYDPNNRLVNWFVGHLDQGQKSDLEVTLVASKAGEHTHFVRATSDAGAVSDAQFRARVEGSPALVLSIRDLDDPVEVGVEAAYEIKIKNEGSAGATNVGLSLELPEGLTLLSANGPTKHATEKHSIVFAPVGDVGPGQTCTFLVKVKGQGSGSVRVRSRLTSDSISEPIVADELTKFYE